VVEKPGPESLNNSSSAEPRPSCGKLELGDEIT
jgi:hypothetical protein